MNGQVMTSEQNPHPAAGTRNSKRHTAKQQFKQMFPLLKISRHWNPSDV